jgi:deoxyribonuclease-4
MRFGAHVSAAGGLKNAALPARSLGCEVIQIFSRSPQSWQAKPLTPEDCLLFKEAISEAGVQAVYLHAPYLINLASSNPRTRGGSIHLLREELERGTLLGAKAMMFHPGSAKDVGRSAGLKLVVDALNQIMMDYEGSCQLLIEISAGAGEVMGDTIEELGYFLQNAERGSEIGLCFDTQHAFASGYDLRSKDKVNDLVTLMAREFKLEQLVATHCNDSKVPLGSHKDRHENIGHGELGQAGILNFLAHPKLQHLDVILETPYEKDGSDGLREADMKIIRQASSK